MSHDQIFDRLDYNKKYSETMEIGRVELKSEE